MKKYRVYAKDCNNNTYPIFSEITETQSNKFLSDYCNTDKKDMDPWDQNYRWLKDYELPEYNIPYRSNGWIVRFEEA